MNVADKLKAATERLADLERKAEQARAASSAATPGGLHGYDPAVVSGIRRKPNQKADARRFNAYSREAEAVKTLDAQRRVVASLEAQLRRAEADAAAPCDLDAIRPGVFVRTRHGWHEVVRRNAKSVTVKTPYSWTDRIDLDRIIEVDEREQREAA